VSRSKEAVYRASGEAAFDEAGSPPTCEKDPEGRPDHEPDAAVIAIDAPRER